MENDDIKDTYWIDTDWAPEGGWWEMPNTPKTSQGEDKSTMTKEEMDKSNAQNAANKETLHDLTGWLTDPIMDAYGSVKDTVSGVITSVQDGYGKVAKVAMIGSALFAAYYGLKVLAETKANIKAIRGKK
ncbi:MAG: hypothetical protein LBQ18_05980 [Campylobacteraceae bacterium]|jgi:hypothetical protein|nr:hypothetical protein [Campylobacteraceae bacterium]